MVFISHAFLLQLFVMILYVFIGSILNLFWKKMWGYDIYYLVIFTTTEKSYKVNSIKMRG